MKPERGDVEIEPIQIADNLAKVNKYSVIEGTQEDSRVSMKEVLNKRNKLAMRLLEQGNVASFNDLREDHPDWIPKLMDLTARAADLRGVNLSGADLRFARIVQSDLIGANLQGANLSDSGLEDTNFQNADLTGTILNYAYLDFADLTNTIGLTAEQLATFNFEKVKVDPELREEALKLVKQIKG